MNVHSIYVKTFSTKDNKWMSPGNMQSDLTHIIQFLDYLEIIVSIKLSD